MGNKINYQEHGNKENDENKIKCKNCDHDVHTNICRHVLYVDRDSLNTIAVVTSYPLGVTIPNDLVNVYCNCEKQICQ